MVYGNGFLPEHVSELRRQEQGIYKIPTQFLQLLLSLPHEQPHLLPLPQLRQALSGSHVQIRQGLNQTRVAKDREFEGASHHSGPDGHTTRI